MQRQHLDVQLQIKAVGDDGSFSGYGSVFDVKDSYGDSISKGAFAKSLAAWGEKGKLPAMLWQHDTSEPIGIYTSMREDDHGLLVEGKILVDAGPVEKRAYSHLKAGSIDGMSIGFNYAPGGIKYNSEHDVYNVTEVDLWEVSLVTFPANEAARVLDVRSQIEGGGVPTARQVERLLRDAGFSRQQAKGIIAKGYESIDLREADDGFEDDVAALKAANDFLSQLRGISHG